MFHQPARRGREGLARWQDVAVAEVPLELGEVEHAVVVQRLHHQGPGRDREFPGQGDDFEFRTEGARHDFDDLPHAEDFFVGAVVDLARGGFGPVDCEQHRVGDVPGVAEVVECQAPVGQNDVAAAVPNAADNAPLAWQELIGTVHVRVAEVRSGGMRGEDSLLRAHDAVALRVFFFALDQGRAFRQRDRQARGFVEFGIHVAPVGGGAAHGNEAPDLASGDGGRGAESPVGCYADVVSPLGEDLPERGFGVGIRVKVLHVVRDLRNFVFAAVQDRDPVTALAETVHDEVARRSCSPDHQCAHGP